MRCLLRYTCSSIEETLYLHESNIDTSFKHIQTWNANINCNTRRKKVKEIFFTLTLSDRFKECLPIFSEWGWGPEYYSEYYFFLKQPLLQKEIYKPMFTKSLKKHKEYSRRRNDIHKINNWTVLHRLSWQICTAWFSLPL